jgi:hypothetical protein
MEMDTSTNQLQSNYSLSPSKRPRVEDSSKDSQNHFSDKQSDLEQNEYEEDEETKKVTDIVNDIYQNIKYLNLTSKILPDGTPSFSQWSSENIIDFLLSATQFHIDSDPLLIIRDAEDGKFWVGISVNEEFTWDNLVAILEENYKDAIIPWKGAKAPFVDQTNKNIAERTNLCLMLYNIDHNVIKFYQNNMNTLKNEVYEGVLTTLNKGCKEGWLHRAYTTECVLKMIHMYKIHSTTKCISVWIKIDYTKEACYLRKKRIIMNTSKSSRVFNTHKDFADKVTPKSCQLYIHCPKFYMADQLTKFVSNQRLFKGKTLFVDFHKDYFSNKPKGSGFIYVDSTANTKAIFEFFHPSKATKNPDSIYIVLCKEITNK